MNKPLLILSNEELQRLINERIASLEILIRDYGSFNIIANSIFRNSPAFQSVSLGKGTGANPVIQEYLALISLKFPFSIGARELMNSANVLKDFHEINKIAEEIVLMHGLFHLRQFDVFNVEGEMSEIGQIAQIMSGEELSVRNETFEEHHWERLESLYEPYNLYFKDKFGFDVNQAIDFCIAISEYTNSQMIKALVEPKAHAKMMYDEARAYKYRNKQPVNFYPPEYLESFKRMDDKSLKSNFNARMMTYTMSMLGQFMQFKIEDIIALGDIDPDAFTAFLKQFCISFGEINADFSMPEVIHPLKDRPILVHEDTYFCSSLSLLDYSLDRLFANTLFKDNSTAVRYKPYRHDYLLNQGMDLLTKTLRTDNYFTNLLYPGGELDGLIFCGNDAFFIEAKGHQVSDRAKKGYFDRIKNHVQDVVEESHYQAIRTHNYLKGNSNAEFKNGDGEKIIIDGSKFKKAYFISLTLESFKAMATSLKVGNSLGLFDKETFPWIISLYDLKVVCDHMEGPAYLIQYMHRRKEFFSLKKIMVGDELDLLAFYLDQNLRFDDLLRKHKDLDHIQLASQHHYFDTYYAAKFQQTFKSVAIKKHYTLLPAKLLVKALENSGVENAIDAAVLILEGNSKTKNTLINSLRICKKKFRKDGQNHDFRLIGHDEADKSSWMLSFWLGFDSPDFLAFFESTVRHQYLQERTNDFYAILDKGVDDYKIVKVMHLGIDHSEYVASNLA